MTKHRPPISIDAALARIAGQLPGSWAQMAELTGYVERTVRRWGDVEAASDEVAARDIPMRAAVKLDVAYQVAGGIGKPIYEAYGDLVGAADIEAFGCKQDLLRETLVFTKENHDAETALFEATMPDAGALELEKARGEVLEVRQWADRLLAKLGFKPP